MTIEDCQQSNYWPKWKNALEAELDLFSKQKVFGLVVHTPKDVKSIGYEWIFVQK